MRDVKRIDEVIQALNEVWHKYPDLRFWQLLSAIPMADIVSANRDLFYVEDGDTLKALQKVIDEGL